MKKIKRSISIDSDLDMLIIARGLNVSRIVNDFLRAFLQDREVTASEDELLGELSTIRRLLEEGTRKLGEKQAELLQVQERNRKEQKERDAKADAMGEALRRSNYLERTL